MDQAFNQIKAIVTAQIDSQTHNLKQEIIELKSQVTKLSEALKEKDQQCRHIAAVLQTKNAEWKEIKEKLAATKLTNKKPRLSEDVRVSAEKESAKRAEIESRNDFHDEDENLTQLDNSIGNQSISKTKDQESENSNVSVFDTQTQSALDALVSLISDTSEGDENNLEKENDFGMADFKMVSPLNNNTSNFARKKKSHARGCACCDKFYSATGRSGSSLKYPQGESSTSNTPPGFWDTSFTPRS